MPNKNIYLNQETNSLLEDLSKKLGKPFSQVIEIALNKYSVENRSMAEFRLCHEQLKKSVEHLKNCRDYEPWTKQDEKILEVLFKAHDPLMEYNNYLISFPIP